MRKVFKTRAEKLGGHWHVQFFSAKDEAQTYAGLGTLIMDDDDYKTLVRVLPGFHAIKAI
jgi:hypothetical protein